MADQDPDTLYDTDVAAWAEQQAGALRRRAANEIDWANVAEEIEGVAASQKREIRSRLRVICEHLLKWRQLRQRRHQGQNWRNTLDEQAVNCRSFSRIAHRCAGSPNAHWRQHS